MSEHPSEPRSFLRRMLVRKLWRAFPELDAYPDKECIAFVKLARSRVLWRLMQMTAVGAVFACTAAAMLLAAGFVTQVVQANAQWIPDAAYVALGIGGVIVVPATSIVSAFLARDFLLRRRLRHILRDTGSCTMCGYSLIGLPIPDSLKVNCPECGYLCAVDVSLSVLVRDDAGEAVGRRMVMQRPRYWTPERRRFWKRLSLGTVGAVIVLAGVPLVTYEIWLRMQAAQARADMPSIDDATALIARHRPGLELVKHPVAFDIIMQIDYRMRVIEQQVRLEGDVSPRLIVDLSCIVPDEAANVSTTRSAHLQPEELRFNERLFAAMDDPELDALFAEMRAAPRQVRDARVPTSQLVATRLPYLGPARQASRLLAARARQAIGRGDTAVAEHSLATIRALCTAIGDQSTVVDRLVAQSMEVPALECVHRWLVSRPSTEELDAIERVWSSGGLAFDGSLTVDFDALSLHAVLADAFAEPSNMRLAPFPGFTLPSLLGASGATIDSPGTWATNRDAIERLRARTETHLELSLPERIAAGRALPPDDFEGAGLVEVFGGKLGGLNMDWIEAELDSRRGVTTLMLALERYRVRHGDYPADIAALTAGFLNEVPRDSTSGVPLSYRRVDPVTDPLGRSYLIYVFGPDGRDNGGLEEEPPIDQTGVLWRKRNALAAIHRLADGADIQLNVARPIPRDVPVVPPPVGEMRVLETLLPGPTRPISPSSAPAR